VLRSPSRDSAASYPPTGLHYPARIARAKPLILFVVTLAEVGGAQSYVRDLVSAGAGEGFDVAVAAHGEGPLKTAATRLDVPFFPLNHVRRRLSPIHDPLGVVELTRLFRRVRPDIVHLNSSKAGVLGRIAAVLARVPVRVFTAHGWAFKATDGVGSHLYLLADRAVERLTSMVICVSENERRAGLAAGVCTTERSLVIRNAVEVGAAPPRARGGEPPVQVVSVGRLAAPKDFPTLIAAVARLPEGRAHLRLFGDGPLRGELEAQTSALGIGAAVDFAGEVPDARPHLEDAEVFVLASLSEGMPVSVLEAMAAGLPVVASAVPGLEEVVLEGETGFLTPPGDSAALAARLGQLVDDPSLRRALGDAGRARAEEHFSLPAWRGAHFSLYRSLLAGRDRSTEAGT
jgi:glycosyltransferase involved in cell wall biosynthesis